MLEQNRFKVKTPIDYLMVEEKGTEDEYPGVYISFSENGKDYDASNIIACVEYDITAKKIETCAYEKGHEEPANITNW